MRVLSSGTLSPTPSQISPRHVDHRKCCQLSSTDDRFQFVTSAFVYNAMGVTYGVSQVHLQ